jgi:hypothetical protein
MDDREREELLRSVQLRVSPEEAREVLLEVRRKPFRDKLDEHWRYEEGNVTLQSKCWLLAWAQDTRNLDIARKCQAAWNEIFDKDFESIAIVGHDFPRKCRDKTWGPPLF